MKIVVLDGHTLNPGDLSWDGFKALGELKVHERTTEDDVVARAGSAEAIFTNKTPLHRETIRKLAKCRYIGVLATGFNVVNVGAAAKKGIVVTNVPGDATAPVCERVFAYLFEFLHEAGYHSHVVHKGRWSRSPDFCFWMSPLHELNGRTMGIVGYGQTGRAVARVARAFGMPVLVHTRRPPDAAEDGVRFADLDTLFRESDVVSLHCPLTPDTQEMVNAYRLSLMKPTAYLVNCARGPLVEAKALAEALNANRLAGAGVDVLDTEPPPANHPLFRTKNCLIAQHNAWATVEARRRLMEEAAENLRCFLAGQPRNLVRSAATG